MNHKSVEGRLVLKAGFHMRGSIWDPFERFWAPVKGLGVDIRQV